MMENEFSCITMKWTSDTLIPNGDGYSDINHQVCTLPGANSGTTNVSGSAYLLQGFSFTPSQIWRNWGIMMALIVFLLVMNIVLGELVSYGMGGNTFLSRVKPNPERKNLNEDLLRKRDEYRKSKQMDHSKLKINSKSVLTWEALNYEVPVPGGTRRLLSNVYGYVKPGVLTALMGASGAGKTTLLDVLAARKNIGVIVSRVLPFLLSTSRSFYPPVTPSLYLIFDRR